MATREGDWDALAALYDPHIVIRTDPRWPEQVIYGREAALAWQRSLWELGGSDVRYEEMLDLGDRVLARFRWVVHARVSGVEGEQHSSVLHTFRDGRVILEEFFIEHEDALKAVGVEDDSRAANLDLVRSIYADWERGDYSATGWADPEMEYAIADGPEPVSGRGVAGIAAAWREVLSAWHDYRAVAEEYRQLDEERVLGLTTFTARGRASNIEVGQVLSRGASLMQIEDDKVTRLVLYFNRENALAELGLEG